MSQENLNPTKTPPLSEPTEIDPELFWALRSLRNLQRLRDAERIMASFFERLGDPLALSSNDRCNDDRDR